MEHIENELSNYIQEWGRNGTTWNGTIKLYSGMRS